MIREADIARACIDVLALDGWRPIKMEPVSDKSRGRGTGEIGQPDYLFLRYSDLKPMAEVLWVEFKRPGGKPTAHQSFWHIAERRRGAMVVCLGQDCPATVDGFIGWYYNSGLQRRK